MPAVFWFLYMHPFHYHLPTKQIVFDIYLKIILQNEKSLPCVYIGRGSGEDMRVSDNGKGVAKRKLFFTTVRIQVYIDAIFVMYLKI